MSHTTATTHVQINYGIIHFLCNVQFDMSHGQCGILQVEMIARHSDLAVNIWKVVVLLDDHQRCIYDFLSQTERSATWGCSDQLFERWKNRWRCACVLRADCFPTRSSTSSWNNISDLWVHINKLFYHRASQIKRCRILLTDFNIFTLAIRNDQRTYHTLAW